MSHKDILKFLLPELTKYVYNSSKSALLSLADTNTDKIPAQISKTHRCVLPGRNQGDPILAEHIATM
jgi:hypothetical protein